MVANLRLHADAVPFETTSSNVTSVHNLKLEAGDPYTCRYSLYSINEQGIQVPYNVGNYTVTAEAHSEDFVVEKTFTVTVKEETAASGIFNVIVVEISAVDTIAMAVNPRYTWGIRFTNKTEALDSFTFIAGVITIVERSFV